MELFFDIAMISLFGSDGHEQPFYAVLSKTVIQHQLIYSKPVTISFFHGRIKRKPYLEQYNALTDVNRKLKN